MRVTSPSADSLLAEEPAFSKDCSRSWNTQMLGSWSKCKRITTLISFQSCNQGNQTLLAEATGSICRIHWNKACPSWFYLCAFVSWSMFPCFEPKNPLARGFLKKIISLRNYSEYSYTYILCLHPCALSNKHNNPTWCAEDEKDTCPCHYLPSFCPPVGHWKMIHRAPNGWKNDAAKWRKGDILVARHGPNRWNKNCRGRFQQTMGDIVG